MFEQLNYYFALLLTFLMSTTGSLGVAIIVFTVGLKALLFPITLNSLKAAYKMRLLQPEIKKIQEKFKKDPQGLQKAQMKLYADNNLNPLAGCLPQILQLVILVLLYQGLIAFFKLEEFGGVVIERSLLWLDLSKPDQFYILPILATVSQFALSYLMMGTPIGDKKNTSKSKNKESKKEIEKKTDKASEAPDMSSIMQKQMLYFMPLITGFISLSFPSGLVLYWVISTVVSAIQQVYANKVAAQEQLAIVIRK